MFPPLDKNTLRQDFWIRNVGRTYPITGSDDMLAPLDNDCSVNDVFVTCKNIHQLKGQSTSVYALMQQAQVISSQSVPICISGLKHNVAGTVPFN